MRNLRWCPTQFQRRIAGVDYRVHMVGEEVFACRTESEADDYRYDGGAKIVACTTDPGLARRCQKLSRRLGITFAWLPQSAQRCQPPYSIVVA